MQRIELLKNAKVERRTADPAAGQRQPEEIRRRCVGARRRRVDRIGRQLPELRIGTRTGDTAAGERRTMMRRPPDILITTPESLYLLLTSQAAATKGSYNLAGVANPAIDAMVEKAIGADTRGDLTTACRALDRLFRAGRYWVPQWYKAAHWIAYWDLFGRPATKPRYARGAPETWWSDREKIAKQG